MSGLTVKNTLHTCCPRPLRAYWDRVEASELGYHLAKGAFWSLTGTFISRGLMLVASILVARMLGKDVFGELGIIRSTVGMFGVFAGFGLGLTATKHVAEFRTSDPTRAGHIIALSGLVAMGTGILMALVLFLFAPWLATHTLNAPHLSSLLRAGCLLLLLNALNGAQTGALAGFEAFKMIARVNVIVGLASFPVLVGGAYWGGVEGVVWGLTLSLAMHWTLNHFALRRAAAAAGVPFGLAGCIREWSILWRFSLPAALSGVMVAPVNWACGAMLVNQPGGYGEMGILNAVNHWFVALLFIPGILATTMLPVLSRCVGAHEESQSARILGLSIKINAAVVLPLVLIASLVSPYIMSSYGQGFSAAWLTLVVALSTAGLLAIQQPVGHLIVASGAMWLGFAMNTAWAAAFLTATWFLADCGSLGLATARLIAYVLHACWTFGFAWLVIQKWRRSLADP